MNNNNTAQKHISTFQFKSSTYYFAGMRIKEGFVPHLQYNLTTERRYYNMSDFTNGKACHLNREASCNVSLPYSDTCLLIHTEYENNTNQVIYHQLEVTGIRGSNKTKLIAVTALSLLILFYLLYLYIMIYTKYICNKN